MKPTHVTNPATYAALLIFIGTLAACSKAPVPSPSDPMIAPTSSAPAISPSTTTQTLVIAELTGSNEVPKASGAAVGELDASLDRTSMVMRWNVSYSGLTGPVTSAHFHGPALAGQNAPPVIPIEPPFSSPISGVVKLTTDQLADLENGKLYFNIHTEANPNGEIRGQLAIKP